MFYLLGLITFTTALLPCTAETTAASDLLAVPTAQQIIAAAGSDKDAAVVVGSAILQDAARRFGRLSEAGYVVSLLDSQWHEQWIPKEGVSNVKDGRRVTFVRVSQADAAKALERCGRLLLLRRVDVTDRKLTVQVVDQGTCSSFGLELTYQRIGELWRLEGEPRSVGEKTPECGCQ